MQTPESQGLPTVSRHWEIRLQASGCQVMMHVNIRGESRRSARPLCQTQHCQGLLTPQGGCSGDGSTASVGDSSDSAQILCPFLLTLQHLSTSGCSRSTAPLQRLSAAAGLGKEVDIWAPKWGAGWEQEEVTAVNHCTQHAPAFLICLSAYSISENRILAARTCVAKCRYLAIAKSRYQQ